jgi:hypothetical protein
VVLVVLETQILLLAVRVGQVVVVSQVEQERQEQEIRLEAVGVGMLQVQLPEARLI